MGRGWELKFPHGWGTHLWWAMSRVLTPQQASSDTLVEVLVLCNSLMTVEILGLHLACAGMGGVGASVFCGVWLELSDYCLIKVSCLV